jgi:hypothetical protein
VVVIVILSLAEELNIIFLWSADARC